MELTNKQTSTNTNAVVQNGAFTYSVEYRTTDGVLSRLCTQVHEISQTENNMLADRHIGFVLKEGETIQLSINAGSDHIAHLQAFDEIMKLVENELNA